MNVPQHTVGDATVRVGEVWRKRGMLASVVVVRIDAQWDRVFVQPAGGGRTRRVYFNNLVRDYELVLEAQ